ISPRTAREVDGTTIPRADTIRFVSSDLAALRASLPAPANVGLTESGVALATIGGTQRAVRLLGTMPSLFTMQNVSVASGRLFTDAEQDARVALLSKKAAKDLAAGDSIMLGGVNLAVIGILGGDQTDKTVTAVVPAAVVKTIAATTGRDAMATIIVRAARFDDVAATR